MFDLLVDDPAAEEGVDAATQRELEGLWKSWSPDPAVSTGVSGLGAGLMLAATLDSVDLGSLPGGDRVAVMVAAQRMVSHYQALLYASMVSVADAVTAVVGEDAGGDLALIEDACATEIRAALRLTRRSADNELATARGFCERLPAVWEALAAGEIDRRRAQLIVARTDHLSVAQARDVADQALEKAPELTSGQLTALVTRLATQVDPDDATQRYTSAVEDRRVILEAGVDGTAHLLLLDLPPDRATRIRAGIDAAARTLRGKGESRTMDQLRVDVVMDLLDPPASITSTSRAGSSRGAVVMTVDLATLAGLTDTAGDLGGFGPVISDIARQVADQSPDAEWRFVITDPDGRPLGGGTTSRRPTTPQRRMIQSLYPRCVFLGCRMPATRCDIDHTTPYADSGVTRIDSLAPLCEHDHSMRHGAGWSYRRTPDGHIEWTSPLGIRYLNRDPPT